jgi:hypothetical protein
MFRVDEEKLTGIFFHLCDFESLPWNLDIVKPSCDQSIWMGRRLRKKTAYNCNKIHVVRNDKPTALNVYRISDVNATQLMSLEIVGSSDICDI